MMTDKERGKTITEPIQWIPFEECPQKTLGLSTEKLWHTQLCSVKCKMQPHHMSNYKELHNNSIKLQSTINNVHM